jgi:outer membrane murein-binding lipoprotein Lpp
MSTDEKVLKILEDVQADIKGLKQGQEGLAAGQRALEAGQKALQGDMTAVKAETAKIPAIEQRLDNQGKLLTGLTATTATVLEEQHAQRSDIRSLHTEVHETREELKGEIEEVKSEVRAARDEAKRDNIDLKASVVKRFQSDERRITNIEEREGIENPEKH